MTFLKKSKERLFKSKTKPSERILMTVRSLEGVKYTCAFLSGINQSLPITAASVFNTTRARDSKFTGSNEQS